MWSARPLEEANSVGEHDDVAALFETTTIVRRPLSRARRTRWRANQAHLPSFWRPWARGALPREGDIHCLPRRLPDSCVTNLGTDEQVMNGKSTASVECQNFNVQICKNRFSLTRCHAQ